MEIQWSLVLFSLLAGCGGGILAIVGISEIVKAAEKARFAATLVAALLIIAGGFCSVTHLARPDRIMWAAQNIFSFSGISVELIFVGLCLVCAVVYLIMSKRNSSDGARVAVAVVMMVLGVGLAFFTGHGYMLESQASWNTLALPLAYTGTALSAGALLFQAIAAAVHAEGENANKLNAAVLAMAAIGAITLVVYIVAIGFDVAGSSPVVTWGGIVVCGIVVACAAAAYACKATPASILPAASVGFAGALLGGLSLRVLMWIVGTGYIALLETATYARIFL